MWDYDQLSADDFIGEVSVALTPLMDGRTRSYTLPLTDPEHVTGAEDYSSLGSITFTLAYES